jgi:hypothetical protein
MLQQRIKAPFAKKFGKAEIVTNRSHLCHIPFTFSWHVFPHAGKYKPIHQSLPGSFGQDFGLPPRAVD